MGVTNGLSLPYPELTESADGPDAFGRLANALEDWNFDRILPAGVTRAPAHHWGSVTTLPSGASVKRGDTAWYSTYNVLVTYDGTNWRQAEIPVVASGDTTPGFYTGQYRDHPEGLQRFNTRWGRVADYMLGEASINAQIVVAGTPSWSDLAVVTATSMGGSCSARWDASVYNGTSGADRTASFQITLDGTPIAAGAINTTFMVALGSNANNHPHIYRTGVIATSPAAGSHTWRLQGNASAAGAVVNDASRLVVFEHP